MPTQEYLTTLTQQTQEASRAAAEAWVRAIQNASFGMPAATGVAATHEVIDQMSDLAVSLINVQRTLAKQVTQSMASASESVFAQARENVSQAQLAVE